MLRRAAGGLQHPGMRKAFCSISAPTCTCFLVAGPPCFNVRVEGMRKRHGMRISNRVWPLLLVGEWPEFSSSGTIPSPADPPSLPLEGACIFTSHSTLGAWTPAHSHPHSPAVFTDAILSAYSLSVSCCFHCPCLRLIHVAQAVFQAVLWQGQTNSLGGEM